RTVRRGRARAPVRAAHLGRLAGDSGDLRLDLPRAGRPAARYQRDEARLSAVSCFGWGSAAGRAPPRVVPGGLLAAHQEARRGAHFALASYNAGENRIARWISERPGFQQDEFVDDIPYPETQNYVKRILGTAEDYRRLYGGGLLVPGGRNKTAATAVVAPTAKA